MAKGKASLIIKEVSEKRTVVPDANQGIYQNGVSILIISNKIKPFNCKFGTKYNRNGYKLLRIVYLRQHTKRLL